MSCDKRAQEIYCAGCKNGYDVASRNPGEWKKEPFQRPAWLDEPLTVTKSLRYHSADEKSAVGSIEKETKMILNMNNVEDIARVKKACKIEGLAEPTLSHFCWYALQAQQQELLGVSIITRTGKMLQSHRFGPVWGFETKTHLFLEQNAQKNSEPGRRARQGHKIMWVIQKTPNKYIGKVEDGVLEVFNK